MKQFKEFVDFVRTTYNTPESFIPLHEPRFRGNEKKYLIDCIDSTFVSSVGKYVDEFEKLVAEFTGSKYAIAAVNGTAAIHISLLLAGVKAGNEVITQPLTFIATANAISYTGAKPIFIDVDRDSMGLSADQLDKFLKNKTEQRLNSETNRYQAYNIKSGNFIGACVPMHTFGHPVKIDKIKEICEKHNVALIEDAAESLGSFYKGKHTGTFGKLGTLSFNGNKTITTGGGGMILTSDKVLAKKAKHITTTAKVPHKWAYNHDMIGYNYRLTNLAAALGVAQIEQLPQILKNKRLLATNYQAFFKNTDIEFINEKTNVQVNYWLNAIVLKDRETRDSFLEYTNSKGVMTRPIWQLMNRLEMFKNCQTEDLSNAEWLVDRVVNIPSSVI